MWEEESGLGIRLKLSDEYRQLKKVFRTNLSYVNLVALPLSQISIETTARDSPYFERCWPLDILDGWQ